MKAPPKRKGNPQLRLQVLRQLRVASMKALPKRKGNLRWLVRACSANLTLNESPSEKEGKWVEDGQRGARGVEPSMKVPPKRKGNFPHRRGIAWITTPQ